MGRLVKCPYCNEKLDKDEAIEFKKRYYHQECLDSWGQEKTHRKELLDYICKLYKIEVPNGYILKQIKDFQEQYHYKLKGMELALRYFHETLNNPVKDGQGIGIIPFVYEKAKQHYIMKMKAEQSLGDIEMIKTKTVTIEPTQFTYKKKTKQIDISSL